MTWTATPRGYKTAIDMGAPNSAEVVGPNHEANARLIAAAPDLLAALETAYEMLVDSWGEEQISAGDDQVANVIKAAIDRAKGA
jgi:hypothetical protein